MANITKRGIRLCANHVSCKHVLFGRLSNGHMVALRLADSTPLIGVSDAVVLPAITMYFQYIIGCSEAVLPHVFCVKRMRSRVYNNTQGKRTWEIFKSTALYTIHRVFSEARENRLSILLRRVERPDSGLEGYSEKKKTSIGTIDYSLEF